MTKKQLHSELRTLEPTVSSRFAVTCANETNRLSLANKVELIELPFFPKEEKNAIMAPKTGKSALQRVFGLCPCVTGQAVTARVSLTKIYPN